MFHPIDWARETRLLEACRKGSYERVCSLLLRDGEKRAGISEYLNETDIVGHAPLETAITEGHTLIANLLIENGADLSYSRRYDGTTPLHCALIHERYGIVRLLLSHHDSSGYYPTVNHAADNGFTPLHIACSNGNAEIVYRLLEKGACAESRDSRGWTPLFLAVWRGHVSVATHLILNGANVNTCDMYNQTPLSIACRRGDVEVVIVLLEHGARASLGEDFGCDDTHLGIAKILSFALKSMATTYKQKRRVSL